MALRGSDGSIILTTKTDLSGLQSGFKSMASVVAKGSVKLAAIVSKTFAVMGVAATTATVAITKMAVSAYADYEQLIGGVETLFKGSAQKVVDYANDAFYTAGVSANEYMKQVILFSAGLIQSVSGDTDKAADVANMALMDMSDNVNKLGTDMERVQLAYQGFARQQYVLLDNLALGYKGTKTEMERLLKDAQALTGVKYDINNLADVYSAIHAIQEELGITGTTAMEAEKTITGSAKMMKAAWQNVLSAIAGGGDLDRAINNFVYSVQKYFENIVPVVQRSLVGIGRLIEQVAPMLVQNVASALIQAIPSLINAVYQMIIGVAKGIKQGIVALFTGSTGSVTADIKTKIDGVTASSEQASTGIEELGKATKKAGKEAQKNLAAFDEITIVQDKTDVSATQDSASGVGDAGSGIAGIGGEGNVKGLQELSQITIPEGLSIALEKLKNACSGFEDIDFSPLVNGLTLLKDPIEEYLSSGVDQIAWGIENAYLPLSKITIEDILPRFFQTLGTYLSIFVEILKGGWGLLRTWWDEWVMPIMNFTAPVFLNTWDEINEKFGSFKTTIEGTSVFEDLSTIFGKIASKLTPIAGLLASIVIKIAGFYVSKGLEMAESIFINLEDAIGLVAAILEGDFSKAWGHLKDLMIDNKIDAAKKDVEELKTSFEEVKTKVGEFVEDWKLKIDDMVESWKTKISAWWTDNVVPWFDLEEWGKLFANIVASVINFFTGEEGFVQTWKTKIEEWWKDDVQKWLSKETWKTEFDNIITSVINFFTAEDGFVKTWQKRISSWWSDDVEPWFKLEKWTTLGTNIKDGIVQGLKGAVGAIATTVNNMIDGFQKAINGAIGLINDFIKGWNTVADVNPLLPSIKKISTIDLSKYKIPGYARGTVVPPNKPFMGILGDNKNETEVVSPVSTIKQALIEAMQETGAAGQPTKEEHYYLNETQLMSIVYKLVKGGERLNGKSLIGGAY